MKQRLFHLFLTAVLAVISANAESYTLSIASGKTFMNSDPLPPERSETTQGDDIIVSYLIEEILISPDTLYAGKNWCILPNFGRTYEPGTPSLPIRIDNIRLPLGADSAIVTLNKVTYKDINCPVTPAHPYLSDESNIGYTKENVPPIEQSTIGEISDMVSVRDFEMTRKHHHVNIMINPCMYDLATETLRIATEIEYTVTPIFSSAPLLTEEQEAAHNAKKIKTLNTLISLMSDEAPYDDGEALYVTDDYNLIDLDKSYLIVTCDQYLEAANSLALLKKKMGYTTHISSRSSWSTGQVRDSIMRFRNSVFDLESVVLLGGFDDIPAPTKTYQVSNVPQTRTYPTDFYYGCFGGDNDKTQDTYLGRIPVNSPDEASDAIQKIYQYFYCPPAYDQFYDRGIHVSYYGDNRNDLYGHIYNSEQCRDIAIEAGKSVTRVYSAHQNANPTYFINDDEPLPQELLRPNYPWTANKDSIAKEINNGAFYLLYRGHGQSQSWVDIGFSTSDFGLLNNSEYPLFLDFTCLNGAFDEENCFAEMLLKATDKGAIGVIAASERTSTDFNQMAAPDAVTSLLIDSKNSFYVPEGVSLSDDSYCESSATIGAILQNSFKTAAAYNYPDLQNHKEEYHIFGDPSTIIWTEQPKSFDAFEVWEKVYYRSIPTPSSPIIKQFAITHQEVQIDLDQEGVLIGVYDYETDLSFMMFATHANFPYFDPVRYEMTIYSPNRVPLTIHKERFLMPNLIPVSLDIKLSLTPNPASSYCEIGYNFAESALENIIGEIQIRNTINGAVYKSYPVNDHMGKISVDVSGFLSGTFLVVLVRKNGANGEEIVASEKLIIQH